jgi:DNA-binding transcriptional ArsR family regulator
MLNPDPNDVRRAARIFKALSHPARLQIACRLSDGSATTQKALIDEFDWPQPTMARHISELRDLGLVTGRRCGQEVELRLGSPVVRGLMEAVCQWANPETGERFSMEAGR